ncbi:MAG: hypothetical protein RIB30_14520 [Thalassospira sp.]|uniref:hypothetical protein n=1 Tax=Thalassospira sp. TaxID=1912094 RepID=UPI0032EEA9C5
MAAGFAAALATGLDSGFGSAVVFAGFVDCSAGTAATFLGAVAGLAAAGAAALGDVAVLLFVLTVLAFSISEEDDGADGVTTAAFFCAAAGEDALFAVARDAGFSATSEPDSDALAGSGSGGLISLGFASVGSGLTAPTGSLTTAASVFLTLSVTSTSACLAAASISEDVITTRFGDGTVFDAETVVDTGLEADLV